MSQPKTVDFDYKRAKAGAELVTVNGQKVRIICWDKKGNSTPDKFSQPIVGLVTASPNNETLACFDVQGNACINDGRHWCAGFSLRIVPEERTGYCNVYRNTDGEAVMGEVIYKTEVLADDALLTDDSMGPNAVKISTAKVTWYE